MDVMTPAEGFLGLEGAEAGTVEPVGRAVIVPFGLEASVCYGGGTGRGPAAALAASHQVELFDEELWCEPIRRFALETLVEPSIPGGVRDALDVLADLCEDVVSSGAFPLVIGGEHSLTPGALRPHVSHRNEIAILHFDAHADLRDGYEGEHFSHASALRRALDNEEVTRLVSVGLRSLSAEDAAFLDRNGDRVQVFWAHHHRPIHPEAVVAALGDRPVYITFDVDAFDSSIMPATGTPEPGGLGWYEALAILRAVFRRRDVIGADIVELAPIEGVPAYDLTVARLAYKILAYKFVVR